MLTIVIDKQSLKNAYKKKPYDTISVSKDSKGDIPDNKIIFEIILLITVSLMPDIDIAST